MASEFYCCLQTPQQALLSAPKVGKSAGPVDSVVLEARSIINFRLPYNVCAKEEGKEEKEGKRKNSEFSRVV
jgi:hypothetical protein